MSSSNRRKNIDKALLILEEILPKMEELKAILGDSSRYAGKRERRPPIDGGLVSDPDIAAEFGGISLMTLYRWTHDKELGFPPVAVKIRNKNYRSRDAIEAFKKKQITQAKEIKGEG